MSDTKPIREGEELNKTNLRAFLSVNLDIKTDELDISQFPSGASNLTYCLKIGGDEFVLRRPPFGNRVKTAHDMAREYKVLSRLSKVYEPAPKPLIFCGDETVIGSEFYLMERRRGLIIRGRSPKTASRASAGSPAANLENSADLRRTVCESFISNLAKLHAIDYEKAGLADLGRPEGYAKRQVEGWTRRYLNAKTDENAELEKVIKWLNQHVPKDETAALVHNDYKFDNIMLDPDDLTEIIAVLDWEMTTIGSPLMDLGTSLGYWMSRDVGEELLSMPFNPRVLMENVSRDELVEFYAVKSGLELSGILYYYVFGSFKIAVIAQQIYYRFLKGFTKDQRFLKFNTFVAELGRIALKAINRKRI